MDIFEFNPWWETGAVEKEFKKEVKRDLFATLRENLDKRTIDAIAGLRRVGKTTIMYQLIDYLINRGVAPKNILYFSFDIEKENIRKIIDVYEEKVLGKKLRESETFLFFDEIHKLADWADKIKVLYDLNPKVKIVISGSASLNLMKNSRESLAGRAKFFYLNPLSFSEFLKLKGEEIPLESDFYIHEKRIRILLRKFLLRGFPQTIDMQDRACREYVSELVVERVLYRDIPESFNIADTELLKILMEYISENPGAIININSLSKSLNRNRKTVRKALTFLELSFLIKQVKNLRGSFLATSRKNRKVYPLHPSLCHSRDEGKIMETLIRSELKAEYYWRSGSYEVDFILKNRTVLPVEVKYKEKIDKSDIKGLVKFCKKFGAVNGLILTRSDERILDMDGINIKAEIIPKFLLFHAKITP
ncbi:ATP-binding protein [Candidatus Pyrohabitans sp.]